MKKSRILSSALVMTMVSFGAYAADGIITGGAGTCTVDVLGVSDNNATANTIATWSLNDYKCGAGQYLDEDTLTCTTCPAGSYCPGGTFTIENAASGTFDCPAGYTESAAGAGTNNECYTACTVANANIEHATAVSGNDYYGTTDADTCTPTNCELGYHVESEIELVEKEPLIPVNYETAGNNYTYIDQSGTADSGASAAGLTANNTWAVNFDYGTVYGRASCQPSADPASVYATNNLKAVVSGTMSMEEFRTGALAVTSEAKANVIVDFAKAYLMRITGQGDMTEAELEEAFTKYFVTFSESSDKNYATDSTGLYCYCQMDGFAPATDGVLGEKISVTSAPWVFDSSDDSADDCASFCAFGCANDLRYDSVNLRAFRAAVFGAFDAVEAGGMCKVTETDCPAGQYLAIVGDAMMCVPCKSGSYCPGGVYTIESENKGTNACPTTHPNSDAGAGADTQCYKACTVATANIAHATAVSGNDYYGTGTDTCSATECVKGYHMDGRIQFVEKTPAVTVDFNTLVGFAAKNGNGEVMQDGEIAVGLTENNTIAVSLSNGILYGRASCQPTMDTGAEYMMNNMNAAIDGSMSIEDFRAGLEPLAGVAKTDFAVEYINAMKSGNLTDEEQTQWDNKLGAVFLSDKNAGYSTSSTGQYCYARADAFQPNGGNKSYLAGTPWVLFPAPFATAEECATNCIMYGAEVLMQMPDVAFGALDYVDVAICAANTINIDWNPDNGGAHTQNMCYYDGEITLPDEPVKVGYTFSGWKLVEPNSTPVQ